MSSLILWTKNEGLFFFVIIISYIIYHQQTKKKIALLFWSFFIIFLKIYLVSLNSQTDMNIFNSNLNIFNTFFFEKMIFIFFHILIAFFKYPIWIIFLLILLFKKNLNHKASIVYFFSSTIFLIFFIYLLQDYKIFKWMVTGSLDRFIFQSSGLIVVFVAYYVNLIFRKF